MEVVTITGTALDYGTYHSSLFSMSFDVSGGATHNYPCQPETFGISVTNFTGYVDNLAVGSTPLAVPKDFSANLGSVTCGQFYQSFGNGPILNLESWGPIFTPGAVIFDGSIGAWGDGYWSIEAAKVQSVTASEPGMITLLALGIAAILARRSLPRVLPAARRP
jgi:hypothetical protein